MKFVFISRYGLGFSTAYRVQQEGNEVYFCMLEDDGIMLNTYKGMLKNVVSDYTSYIDKDTTVVFDSSTNGDSAYWLKKAGYKTFGGSVFADRVERDRLWGLLTVAADCGLNIPETRLFTDLNDALVFLRKTKNLKRWVFKPQGFYHESYTPATAVLSKEYPEDDLEQIFGMFAIGDFILQEFIPGEEIAWEAWYSEGERVGDINMTFDGKKLFDHDKGPTVGGTVNVDIVREPETCKIYQETCIGIEKLLKAARYTGPFDLAFIISSEDGKPYFLEFTPRMGYPSSYALFHGTPEVGKVFYEYAHGKATERYLDRDKFYATALLSAAPFPYNPMPRGVPIRFNPAHRDNLWFQFMIEEQGVIKTAGACAEIAYVCDYGNSLLKVNENILNIMRQVKVPVVYPLQYREDMVEVTLKRIKAAIATGYVE